MKLLIAIAVLTASIVADALFNNAHYLLVVSLWLQGHFGAVQDWIRSF